MSRASNEARAAASKRAARCSPSRCELLRRRSAHALPARPAARAASASSHRPAPRQARSPRVRDGASVRSTGSASASLACTSRRSSPQERASTSERSSGWRSSSSPARTLTRMMPAQLLDGLPAAAAPATTSALPEVSSAAASSALARPRAQRVDTRSEKQLRDRPRAVVDIPCAPARRAQADCRRRPRSPIRCTEDNQRVAAPSTGERSSNRALQLDRTRSSHAPPERRGRRVSIRRLYRVRCLDPATPRCLSEAIASARGQGSAWADRSRALAARARMRELRRHRIGS